MGSLTSPPDQTGRPFDEIAHAPDLHRRTRPRKHRSVRGLSVVVVSLLCAQILDRLAVIGQRVQVIGLLDRILSGGPVTRSEMSAPDERLKSLWAVGLAMYVATALAWLVWQYLAQSNLVRRRVPTLEFSPKAAVGWWFVPFANLARPYRTMTELLAASEDPVEYRPRAIYYPLLIAWWACLIVSGILAWAVRSPVGADASSALVWRRFEAEEAVIALSSIVAASLAVLIVRRVTKAQERTVSMPPAPLPEVPPPPR